MTTQDFDQSFDDGESILASLDLTQATRPGLDARRVNVDFPDWLLKVLSREADRVGVTRQALIKLWLAERLKQEAQK